MALPLTLPIPPRQLEESIALPSEADFLGTWRDSAGSFVAVTCETGRLSVTLTKQNNRVVRLPLVCNEGRWRCGNADLLKTSRDSITWEFPGGCQLTWSRGRAESDTTASDDELDALEDLDSPRSVLEGQLSPCEAYFAGQASSPLAQMAPPGQWLSQVPVVVPVPLVAVFPAPAFASVEAEQLRGDVWRQSCDPQGCRRVQNVLELVDSATAFSLASELRGHVWQAAVCPHANYVLQKCITVLEPVADWIVDEVVSWGSEGVAGLARHKSGCRIFERLLENCSDEQKDRLFETIRKQLSSLARDQFGNYSMQHLVEYGLPKHRAHFARVARAEPTLATDYYAAAVVTKCMEHCCLEDKEMLAEEILQQPQLVQRMALYRFSTGAVRQMLWLPCAQRTREALAAGLQDLQSTSYGLEVLKQAQLTW